MARLRSKTDILTPAAVAGDISASTTAPTNPIVGQRWYKPETAVTYQYTSDSASSFWLDISSGGTGTSASRGVDMVGDIDPHQEINGTAAVGSVYYNRVKNKHFICTSAASNSNVWIGRYSAIGGTETMIKSGTDYYRVHTFKQSGRFYVEETVLCEVLLVAGGGGGGRAGGGGAGGLVQLMTGVGNVGSQGLLSLGIGSYNIIVGQGGIGDTMDSVQFKVIRGATDTIMSGGAMSTLTAKGGGYGGWSSVAGTSGGCGGGGGFNSTTTAPASNQATGFGSYTGIGFGNAGGAGAGSSGSNSGGAGGGAGGAGAAGSGTNPPDGGLGKQININGTNTWYSGGGTGAGHSGSNVYSVAQTQGSGYTTTDTSTATAVKPTTYGSGGCGIHDTYQTNFTQFGMQGICIIRYQVNV